MNRWTKYALVSVSVLIACVANAQTAAQIRENAVDRTDSIVALFPEKPSFLTLDQVRKLTRENHPLVEKIGIIDQNRKFELLKAEWGYLPTIVLSAQATYQTEVVSFPDLFVTLGGFDKLSNDQYNASILFEQKIWDGGDARLKKQIAESQADVDFSQLEVDLYQMEAKAEELYFGIILMEESINQTDLFIERLRNNLEMMESSYEKGVISKLDLDKIKVSMVEAMQKRDGLVATLESLRKSLSLFVGYDIGDTELRKPIEPILRTVADSCARPEYSLFNAQRSLYDNMIKQVDVRKYPQFSFFMQGSYGRPGYNMLDNDFRPYGIVGFKMNWSISSFFYSRRVKDLMQYNAVHNVDMAKDLFEFQLNSQVADRNAEIGKLKSMIAKDDEMLELRKSIRASTEEMYSKGLVSVTELLDNINLENQTALNRIIHEIELLKAEYSLKHTLNY